MNLFLYLIYLIYFCIDTEKLSLGMLNKVYVCIYHKQSLC